MARAHVEQRVARTLDVLSGAGWTVLHDRLMPASAHRLSHVAIGPAGVAVITPLPDTGNLAIVGGVTERADDRQLYAGSLHLGTWLRTRVWETDLLEAAIAEAHQDIVWQGPTFALAVDVPATNEQQQSGPPELPYGWQQVLIRPLQAVEAMLLGLPSPMSTSAVADTVAIVDQLCRPAGLDDQNNPS